MWCRIPMGQQLILRTLMEGLTNRVGINTINKDWFLREVCGSTMWIRDVNHQFFSEPTLLKRDIHMVLPQTSLSYTSTMQSFKSYLKIDLKALFIIRVFFFFSYKWIFQQNCALFGGKPCVDGEIIPLRDKPTSLLRDNQKFANASFTLPASNSAVFHAGTIGRGLKPQDVRPKTSKVQPSISPNSS